MIDLSTCLRCHNPWSNIDDTFIWKCTACEMRFFPRINGIRGFPRLYLRLLKDNHHDKNIDIYWGFDPDSLVCKQCYCYLGYETPIQKIILPTTLPFNITLDKLKLYLTFL